MIHIKYTELFSVEFSHDFYSGGTCRDFYVEPAEITRQQLKSQGWIFRQENGQFTVFAEVSGADGNNRPLLKRPLKNDIKLIFSIRLGNPFLANFSKLPLSIAPQQFYYFSNLNRKVEAGLNLLAGPGNSLDHVSGDDLMNAYGHNYSFHHTANAATRTGGLSWIDSGEELSLVLKNNGNKFDFQFLLDQLPQGRCLFSVNGTEKERFYAAKELKREKLFGITEILTGDAVPSDYRFVVNSGRSVRFRKYSITFAKRATFWRYFVINKFGNELTDPGVVRQNGSVMRFDEDTDPAYPAGSRVFISRDPLALQEEKLLNINLRRNFSPSDPGSGSVFIEHLPNPSIAQVKPDLNDPLRTYSDVYVYV